MAPIEELKKKRSSAKRNFTLQVNALDPLLDQKGEDAVKAEKRIRGDLELLETRFKAFTVAHEAYVVELENVTEEADLDSLDEEQKYLTEVKDTYFKFERKVEIFDAEVKTVKDKV